MRTAIVIPVGPGRDDNLRECLASIEVMTVQPDRVVIVCDGPEVKFQLHDPPDHHTLIRAEKHQPGMEQPRNIGVRAVERLDDSITHVWFVDSDIILDPNALLCYQEASGDAYRILVGPYDWLPTGVRRPMPELRNDPRWISFDEHDPLKVLVDDLSAGLACFSGNLVWPIDEFTRIGGFWNELHHGRCEDGELGLRAIACGVPISFVRGARGWHLDHPVNFELTLQRNERDVPMLNEHHPWMEGRCVCGKPIEEHYRTGCTGFVHYDDVPGELPDNLAHCCKTCGMAEEDHHRQGQGCEGFKKALFIVEEDGKRFNTRCVCGWEGNTAEIWAHQAECLPETLQ